MKAKQDPPETRFVTLCGRKFYADVRYFPKAEYKGRTIIFCTDSCLNAFKADPEKFYRAHRNHREDKVTIDEHR